MSQSHRSGLLLLLAVLGLDQLTKWAVLATLEPRGPIEVTPFFNLVLVWNRGISFGLLSRAPEWGPWGLVLLTLVIAVVLVAWLRRETRPLSRAALWLVLAGAAGNLIDRLRFGAVVDFLDFHVQGYHWPAFNVADSAIVVGAALLLLDGLLLSRAPVANASEKG